MPTAQHRLRFTPVRARVLLGQGFWAGNFDDSGFATGNIFWEAKKHPDLETRT